MDSFVPIGFTLLLYPIKRLHSSCLSLLISFTVITNSIGYQGDKNRKFVLPPAYINKGFAIHLVSIAAGTGDNTTWIK